MSKLKHFNQAIEQLTAESEKLKASNGVLQRVKGVAEATEENIRQLEQLKVKQDKAMAEMAVLLSNLAATNADYAATKEEISQALNRYLEEVTSLVANYHHQVERLLEAERKQAEDFLKEALQQHHQALQQQLQHVEDKLLNTTGRFHTELTTAFRQEQQQLRDAVYGQIDRVKGELKGAMDETMGRLEKRNQVLMGLAITILAVNLIIMILMFMQ